MDFGYYFLIRDYKDEEINLKKGHAVYVIQIEDGFAKTSSGAIIDAKWLKRAEDIKVDKNELFKKIIKTDVVANYYCEEKVDFNIEDLLYAIEQCDEDDDYFERLYPQIVYYAKNSFELFPKENPNLSLPIPNILLTTVLCANNCLNHLSKEEAIKLCNQALIIMKDPFDVDSYPDCIIRTIAKAADKNFLNNIAKNNSLVNLYNDLMDKGCQNEIEECVLNIAYENYEGSPINEPNYRVAKTYLLKLLNEFEDPGAANTLGYLHYYYDDSVDHFKKAFEYFSIGALAKHPESIYKCSDILKGGYLGYKNLSLAFDIVDDLFINQYFSLCKDNFYTSKLADVALRLSAFHAEGEIENADIVIGSMLALIAKKAIELRMDHMDYIGDESVYKSINGLIDCYKYENIVEDIPYLSINEMLRWIIAVNHDNYEIRHRLYKNVFHIIFKSKIPHMIIPCLEEKRAIDLDTLTFIIKGNVNTYAIELAIQESIKQMFINDDQHLIIRSAKSEYNLGVVDYKYKYIEKVDED